MIMIWWYNYDNDNYDMIIWWWLWYENEKLKIASSGLDEKLEGWAFQAHPHAE